MCSRRDELFADERLVEFEKDLADCEQRVLELVGSVISLKKRAVDALVDREIRRMTQGVFRSRAEMVTFLELEKACKAAYESERQVACEAF